MPPSSVSVRLRARDEQRLEGAERAHDLARECVEHGGGARRRIGETAAEDAVLALRALGFGQAEQAVLGERLGQRRAGHRHAARRDRPCRPAAGRRSSCGGRGRRAARAGQLEGGGEVAEHEALGLERARLAARRRAASRSAPRPRRAARSRPRPRRGSCRRPRSPSRRTTWSSSSATSSSTSKGTAWASLRRSAKGKESRREEMRSRAQRGDDVRGRELVERHEAADQLRAAGSRRSTRGNERTCAAEAPRNVCCSSTALMLWLPRSSPSTFFSTGIGVSPSPDAPG